MSELSFRGYSSQASIIDSYQFSKEIRRIVVKVFDPAYFYTPREKRFAISMDNGCNFAAALAGVSDLLDYDFFYRQSTNR